MHALGAWRWFCVTKVREPSAWSLEFLRLFTDGRASPAHLESMLADNCTSQQDGDTLVLTIPAPAAGASGAPAK